MIFLSPVLYLVQYTVVTANSQNLNNTSVQYKTKLVVYFMVLSEVIVSFSFHHSINKAPTHEVILDNWDMFRPYMNYINAIRL